MKAENSSPFSDQNLTEKLLKLNNSQQSIQTLSLWCIFHQKKARQVVEIWETQFNSASKDQKVSFLYLANDILQNSRRKGNEFVNEFWKVLPRLLKHVYENGEENEKKVIMRLVEIWYERKVFGSRGRSLKIDIMGDAPPPALDDNDRNINPVKIVKKDATTLRIKLAVGERPERIITAFQSLLDELANEDSALNKCKASIHALEDIGIDASIQDKSSLMAALKEQEMVLRQSSLELETIETMRIALIDQLKQALVEQESKSDLVRRQIQAARAEMDRTVKLRQQLASQTVFDGLNPSLSRVVALSSSEAVPPVDQCTSAAPAAPPIQMPSTFLSGPVNSADGEHKKAAAAMAAKLTASASSAQVLSSVLSSLVAQEAASKIASPGMGAFSVMPPSFQADKRPRLETVLTGSDVSTPPYFGQIPASQQIPLPQATVHGMQPISQTNHPSFRPAPPLPSLPPPHLQQHYGHNNGGTVTAPMGIVVNPLPPPPPLPLASVGMHRQNTTVPLPQQKPASEFLQSPGIGFFNQVPADPSQRQ